ncbi:hypothetical protein QBC46DRAFT_344463 [Diplogelasinospora grovesii]|uniref:Uncharacterized protein n=1 Tax=Diplogelasinospora grovesii TaxID=303347 RepID=A0AAN6N2S5_9PEZI|nr:hypothetical protein QBC46DRAFT_344463 [Diplogelasinospora grovesii]
MAPGQDGRMAVAKPPRPQRRSVHFFQKSPRPYESPQAHRFTDLPSSPTPLPSRVLFDKMAPITEEASQPDRSQAPVKGRQAAQSRQASAPQQTASGVLREAIKSQRRRANARDRILEAIAQAIDNERSNLDEDLWEVADDLTKTFTSLV